MRPHQRYDAEQIQRDMRLVGSGQKLYGALINYKLFDYELDFGGAEESPTTWPPARYDDLEFGLLVHGEQIAIELRADAARATRQASWPSTRNASPACWTAGWRNRNKRSANCPLMSADEQAAVTSGRPGRR